MAKKYVVGKSSLDQYLGDLRHEPTHDYRLKKKRQSPISVIIPKFEIQEPDYTQFKSTGMSLGVENSGKIGAASFDLKFKSFKVTKLKLNYEK